MKPVTMVLQNLKHAKLRFPTEKNSGVRSIEELKEMMYSHARNLNVTAQPAEITLDPRKKEESHLTVVVPLSSDPSVRSELTNSEEKIRIGKLFEWIDTVASCSALMMNRSDLSSKNFDVGTLPRIFTTDRFHQSDFLTGGSLCPFEDIVLESTVSWTNSSQTEVTIQVKQKEEELLVTRLVMSSVNPLDVSKTTASSQLEVSGAYQTFLHLKREKINNSPALDPPASHLKFPTPQEGGVTMSSTCIQSTLTTQLDSGNPSGTVSGGFLIRNAMETAETCGQLFAGKNSCYIFGIVDSKLQKPIPIGSMLQFHSFVANVNEKKNNLQIATNVKCYNNNHFERLGDFMFTFEVSGEQKLPQVIPETIDELLVNYRARNVGNKPKIITTSCY